MALTSATTPEMLRAPTFKMHPLKGELTRYYSIWVNEIGVLLFAL